MNKKLSVVLVLVCAAIVASVRTGGAYETKADPPILRATVNFTIGAGNEELPEYEIGYLSGLIFDAKGNIYASDGKSNLIRVYTADGKYSYTIGRKGAGPGDFDGPGNISIAKDGTLWVRENGNQRYSVIQPVQPIGKFVKSMPMSSRMVSPDRTHWNAAGQVAVLAGVAGKPGEPFKILRSFVDDKGKAVTVDTAPPISPDSTEVWIITTASSSSRTSKPFGINRIAAFGGDGMAAFATNSVYAVSLVNSTGKQVALLKRSVPAVKLSAREIETVEKQRDRLAKSNNVPASTLKLDIPKTKPALGWVGFDIDGRLWVARSMADGSVQEADLYSSDGKWLGIRQWAANVSLNYLAVKGNDGLGSTTDADGGVHIVRLTWK